MSNNTRIPLNYKELPKQFSRELKTELGMRRSVWRTYPGQDSKFIKFEQQTRYDLMILMKKVFDEMQPRELEKIVTRILRKNQEAQIKQNNLFGASKKVS